MGRNVKPLASLDNSFGRQQIRPPHPPLTCAPPPPQRKQNFKHCLETQQTTAWQVRRPASFPARRQEASCTHRALPRWGQLGEAPLEPERMLSGYRRNSYCIKPGPEGQPHLSQICLPASRRISESRCVTLPQCFGYSL